MFICSRDCIPRRLQRLLADAVIGIGIAGFRREMPKALVGVQEAIPHHAGNVWGNNWSKSSECGISCPFQFGGE